MKHMAGGRRTSRPTRPSRHPHPIPGPHVSLAIPHPAAPRWAHPVRHVRRGTVWLVCWLAAGLVVHTSDYVIFRAAGARGISWVGGVVPYLMLFAMWALVSPLMVAAGRRLPVEAPHRVRNGALHLLLAPAFAMMTPALYVVIAWSAGMADAGTTLRQALMAQVPISLLLGVQIYGTVVAIVHLLRSQRALRERALAQSRLETQLAEAQLSTLRAQLRPHFLFNTLNSISALMAHDVPAARRMVARLSDLLRQSLEGDEAQETSLGRELAFLESYVDVQRTRFRDRLSVEYAVEPGALAARVPRLILQPLVENAIVHGIGPRPGPGRVRVAAAVDGGRLRLAVEDDGVGLDENPPAREGVGIGNTRARLRALYGDAHALELEDADGAGARVRITLPFVPGPAEEANS